MEQTTLPISAYVDILKRRKWSLLLPALLVFAVVAAVALMLPPVYKSTSTILIEEQEIPRQTLLMKAPSQPPRPWPGLRSACAA